MTKAARRDGLATTVTRCVISRTVRLVLRVIVVLQELQCVVTVIKDGLFLTINVLTVVLSAITAVTANQANVLTGVRGVTMVTHVNMSVPIATVSTVNLTLMPDLSVVTAMMATIGLKPRICATHAPLTVSTMSVSRQTILVPKDVFRGTMDVTVYLTVANV